VQNNRVSNKYRHGDIFYTSLVSSSSRHQASFPSDYPAIGV
jgi:hypothetical protein